MRRNWTKIFSIKNQPEVQVHWFFPFIFVQYNISFHLFYHTKAWTYFLHIYFWDTTYCSWKKVKIINFCEINFYSLISSQSWGKKRWKQEWKQKLQNHLDLYRSQLTMLGPNSNNPWPLFSQFLGGWKV